MFLDICNIFRTPKSTETLACMIQKATRNPAYKCVSVTAKMRKLEMKYHPASWPDSGNMTTLIAVFTKGCSFE